MRSNTMRKSYQRVLTAVIALVATPYSVIAQESRMSAAERLAAYQTHRSMVEESFFKNLPWQHLGPTNISGRSTDIALTEPRGETYTIYVAGASGGVWKTENEGVTWTSLFDEQLTTSIGDVAIAPSDSEIVWVGTGEANIFRSSHAGAGIYKSTDGGSSWQHMGLTETQTIGRIIVHPENPNVVWVAASGHEYRDNPDRGVYKTVDGGQNWNKVLFIDDMTGAIDLVIHPLDPNTLYAATWQRRRAKFNDPRNEPAFTGSDEYFTGSGVWKSTDGGESWRQMNEGLPSPRYRGRIGIDIALSQPETIYAFVDNYEISREAEEGEADAYGRPRGGVIRGATVFRSDNGGGSWRRTSEHNQFMERLGGTYGWVFGQLRVDPNNPDKIYVMGLGLNVSEDSGRTFRQLTGMHVDHHGLYIDPNNSDYLVNSNDGGAYVSYDGGDNWRFFGELPMVQFFNVNFDMGDPFRVYGSVQDHGSYTGIVNLNNGRHEIPTVEFDGAPGGEGSHHAIDPRDTNIVYSAGFYGTISRTNRATGETRQIVPRPPEGEFPYRGQWLAHFIISPHDPNTIYHGMNYVFRSTNRGDDWERISPDLTHNDPDRLGDIQFQTITALSESPITEGLLYAGSDDGRVHVTQDGGESWIDISGGLHPDRFTSEVVASEYHESTVYVTQNGRRSDDFAPYVWRSTDYGDTWESIADGIPFGPVNIIREDPKNPNLLYLGNDVGVYVSLDKGSRWHALPYGLPSTFVHDLVIHPRDDIMVAATHGRGMFAFDVRQLQQLTTEIVATASHMFEPESGVLALGNGRGRSNTSAAQSAYVHYWLNEQAEVSLEIEDNRGQMVNILEASGDPGLHAVEWTLERLGSDQGGRGAGFSGRSDLVQPGEYTVILSVNDAEHRMPLRVSRRQP